MSSYRCNFMMITSNEHSFTSYRYATRSYKCKLGALYECLFLYIRGVCLFIYLFRERWIFSYWSFSDWFSIDIDLFDKILKRLSYGTGNLIPETSKEAKFMYDLRSDLCNDRWRCLHLRSTLKSIAITGRDKSA